MNKIGGAVRGILLLLMIGLFGFSGAPGLPQMHAAAASGSEKSGAKGELVKKNGAYYFYDSDGKRVKKQWVTIDGDRYYFKKDGKAATGSYKTDGTLYLFNNKGHLMTGKKSRFVTLNNRQYYVDAEGRVTTGWFVVDDHLYYATKGRGKISTVDRDGITFKKKQNYAKNTLNSRLKKETVKVLSDVTDSGMTKSQKLRACWNYLVGSGWQYSQYNCSYDSGWQKECAYQMLLKKRGDCKSWACAFAALADEIGYDAYVIRGMVPRAGGGSTPHSWVRINGKYYDPEGQWAGWNTGQYAKSSYNAQISVTKIYQFSSY